MNHKKQQQQKKKESNKKEHKRKDVNRNSNRLILIVEIFTRYLLNIFLRNEKFMENRFFLLFILFIYIKNLNYTKS